MSVTAAGQTVMHCHCHVIPRYVGDVPDARGGVGGLCRGSGGIDEVWTLKRGCRPTASVGLSPEEYFTKTNDRISTLFLGEENIFLCVIIPFSVFVSIVQ